MGSTSTSSPSSGLARRLRPGSWGRVPGDSGLRHLHRASLVGPLGLWCCAGRQRISSHASAQNHHRPTASAAPDGALCGGLFNPTVTQTGLRPAACFVRGTGYFLGVAPGANRVLRPIPVPRRAPPSVSQGRSDLLTAGLTCSLHLRTQVWQEVGGFIRRVCEKPCPERQNPPGRPTGGFCVFDSAGLNQNSFLGSCMLRTRL